MNYREEINQGEIKTWRRAKQVILSNPYNGVPSVRFVEEDLTTLPDGSHISQNESQITVDYSSPDNSFHVINPETGEQMGMATDGQLYALLFSKYLDEAGKRDVIDELAREEAERRMAEIESLGENVQG